MKHGKKYVDSAKLIDRAKLYDTTEALELCVKQVPLNLMNPLRFTLN